MRDYPPVPRVPDLSQPPSVCVAWVIAAEHEAIIDDLCGSSGWYWPAVGELTTGCICRDAPGWYPGRPDNPACPAHGRCLWPSEPVEKHATPPCLCRYGLRPVQGVVGTHQLDPFGHYTRDWGVYAFRIHPKCSHHGDALSDQAADRLYELVLDPDERGGR